MKNILNMLFVTRPLVLNPQLAAEIGLNEAIVLQQIKYWTDVTEHKKDGLSWVYKTVADWESEFPFWSQPTIRRTIKSLEKSQLILCQKLHGHFFNDSSNQTMWYALNLGVAPCAQSDHIDALNLNTSNCSNRSHASDQSDHFYTTDQNDHFSTETTTETTSEITYSSSQNSSDDNVKVRPDAAIQTPEGKYWGTEDDVKAANWIYQRVLDVNSTARKPSLVRWSDDIRKMRNALNVTHRDICKLFKFANEHHFWSENIQSPKKLRHQWDTLQAQCNSKNKQKKPANDLDWNDTSWADELNLEDFK
ncbi:hypothetical protein [Vibrio harveyi]|uniref:hypothetical protein n=1 Tax=Vibrio harveyi TaxID=669 RepID=UPI003CEBAB71